MKTTVCMSVTYKLGTFLFTRSKISLPGAAFGIIMFMAINRLSLIGTRSAASIIRCST